MSTWCTSRTEPQRRGIERAAAEIKGHGTIEIEVELKIEKSLK